MKPVTLTTLAITAFATSTSASNQIVKNYCAEDVFLTLAGSAGPVDGPFSLPSGQAFDNVIIGTGNTCTVSKDANVYSPEVAKMVLGTSTDNGILYWNLNNSSGDPFVGELFNVTSDGSAPNVCGNETTYGDNINACQDQGVTLTLSLC